MRTVNIHYAKAHLSRLVDAVVAGEEIIIAKAGTPVARLAPLELGTERGRRRLGGLIGRAVIPPDFDAPLPGHVIDALEGRGAVPDRVTRRRILEEVGVAGAAKAVRGVTAAASQDFLYGEDGLPK